MTTIYDVAKAASVSPKTVSRVLNGDGPVGRETRAAVERAMADLRYVPSSAARAMRSNRSGLVGLVTGAISLNPEQPALSGLPELFVVQGVQKALEEAGMTLMISDTGGKADRIPDLLRTFVRHRAEVRRNARPQPQPPARDHVEAPRARLHRPHAAKRRQAGKARAP